MLRGQRVPTAAGADGIDRFLITPAVAKMLGLAKVFVPPIVKPRINLSQGGTYMSLCDPLCIWKPKGSGTQRVKASALLYNAVRQRCLTSSMRVASPEKKGSMCAHVCRRAKAGVGGDPLSNLSTILDREPAIAWD
jgi:hypothetical protein